MSTGNTTVIEHQFHEGFTVTDEIKEDFREHGYVILRNLLSEAEASKLKSIVETDPSINSSKYSRDDGEGAQATTVLWKDADDSVSGRIVRSHKVAGTMEQLLGGEVYPYHIKLSLKEAGSGGAWVWHQDYGYWYEDGCLFPDMAACYIAVDKATKENGCLKMLVGSHKAGRIDHVPQGGQVGAQLERVAQLQAVLPLMHAELAAGDAIFFHSNMLHRSDQNRSPHRRYGFIVSFNRDYNSPVEKGQTASATYRKMDKVANSSILEASTSLQSQQFTTAETYKFALNKVQGKVQAV